MKKPSGILGAAFCRECRAMFTWYYDDPQSSCPKCRGVIDGFNDKCAAFIEKYMPTESFEDYMKRNQGGLDGKEV